MLAAVYFMSEVKIQIGFNPLLPSVAEQLKKQGFKYSDDEATEFEYARNAIFNLSIMGLLTDKQEAQIKAKLFSQIIRHVKKQSGIKSKIAVK